jgi:hypothetical protein
MNTCARMACRLSAETTIVTHLGYHVILTLPSCLGSRFQLRCGFVSGRDNVCQVGLYLLNARLCVRSERCELVMVVVAVEVVVVV